MIFLSFGSLLIVNKLLKKGEFIFLFIRNCKWWVGVSLYHGNLLTLLPCDLDRSKTIMWWYSQTKLLLDITDCHLFIYKRTLSVIIAIYINTSSIQRATESL